MPGKAPRLPRAGWRGLARGAWLAAVLLGWGGTGAAETAGVRILSAAYDAPTTRYAHGVLGDAIEYGELRLKLADCSGCAARRVVLKLPVSRVFEDIAPRLVSLSPQGPDLVVVVESDAALGARLALYAADGLFAATPFIGQRNRWLAPVAWQDLDADGALEFAYIDRPHLAKTLRVWRLEDGNLREVASLEGLSNHRIGWDYIEGGVRNCGAGPEMILASGDWTDVIAVRFDGRLSSETIAAYSASAVEKALRCE